MNLKAKYGEIWLVRFPFSDLTSTKVRPALVIAVHREELIILGIFSKIPTVELQETWVLIPEDHPDFLATGLKKTSLIRGDKIATVNQSVFMKQLGTLSPQLLGEIKQALKKSLDIA